MYWKYTELEFNPVIAKQIGGMFKTAMPRGGGSQSGGGQPKGSKKNKGSYYEEENKRLKEQIERLRRMQGEVTDTDNRNFFGDQRGSAPASGGSGDILAILQGLLGGASAGQQPAAASGGVSGVPQGSLDVGATPTQPSLRSVGHGGHVSMIADASQAVDSMSSTAMDRAKKRLNDLGVMQHPDLRAIKRDIAQTSGIENDAALDIAAGLYLARRGGLSTAQVNALANEGNVYDSKVSDREKDKVRQAYSGDSGKGFYGKESRGQSYTDIGVAVGNDYDATAFDKWQKTNGKALVDQAAREHPGNPDAQKQYLLGHYAVSNKADKNIKYRLEQFIPDKKTHEELRSASSVVTRESARAATKKQSIGGKADIAKHIEQELQGRGLSKEQISHVQQAVLSKVDPYIAAKDPDYAKAVISNQLNNPHTAQQLVGMANNPLAKPADIVNNMKLDVLSEPSTADKKLNMAAANLDFRDRDVLSKAAPLVRGLAAQHGVSEEEANSLLHNVVSSGRIDQLRNMVANPEEFKRVVTPMMQQFAQNLNRQKQLENRGFLRKFVGRRIEDWKHGFKYHSPEQIKQFERERRERLLGDVKNENTRLMGQEGVAPAAFETSGQGSPIKDELRRLHGVRQLYNDSSLSSHLNPWNRYKAHKTRKLIEGYEKALLPNQAQQGQPPTPGGGGGGTSPQNQSGPSAQTNPATNTVAAVNQPGQPAMSTQSQPGVLRRVANRVGQAAKSIGRGVATGAGASYNAAGNALRGVGSLARQYITQQPNPAVNFRDVNWLRRSREGAGSYNFKQKLQKSTPGIPSWAAGTTFRPPASTEHNETSSFEGTDPNIINKNTPEELLSQKVQALNRQGDDVVAKSTQGLVNYQKQNPFNKTKPLIKNNPTTEEQTKDGMLLFSKYASDKKVFVSNKMSLLNKIRLWNEGRKTNKLIKDVKRGVSRQPSLSDIVKKMSKSERGRKLDEIFRMAEERSKSRLPEEKLEEFRREYSFPNDEIKELGLDQVREHFTRK